MAKTESKEAKKGGWAERGLRYLRDMHAAIGAAALVGALVFPPLATVAAVEGVNAVAHDELRKAAAKGRKKPA